MNERARRHQHVRRSNNHQNSHHQPSGSSSSSYQQQHQHHNRSIAYHHGHPADTYSASNYRHPSTTTTATDPSSTAPSQTSGDCAISICYSYLIAIFSSFLVVLGIYLSVTRFNVRFLYISLIGLLIEAVGACVYCVSNIRASKLARRKQRINPDEFILNSGSNIDNNLLANNLNGHQTHHPQRHHQQNQQLQQQITTVTHILSNRDLTSSNTTDEGNSRNNINENSSSAITNNNNNDNTQLPQSDQQQTTRREQEDEQTTVADQASSPIHPTSENPEARDGNSIIMIPSSSSQSLVDDQTDDLDQQTDQQPDHSNQASQPSCSTNTQPSQVASITGEADQQEETTTCVSLATDTFSNQLPNQDCQQSPITTSGNFSSSTNLLDNDQQQLHHQRPLEHSPKHHQRPAHLRRTMVIGLGGEEEMIEIDEQELDNMSILPPSYESITMNDPFMDK